MFRAYIVS